MASFAKFPGHMVALWLAVAGCTGGGNPQDTVVCSPPCVDGETCEDGRCVPISTRCTDTIDNDDDGWIDALDPDCASSDDETGLGTHSCNDGVDNDGDGAVDAVDPECTSGTGDEVLGDAACADTCEVGATEPGKRCQLWDSTTMSWIDGIDDGAGHLHNRARTYTAMLRTRLMPVGGVMRAKFSDGSFAQVLAYGGTRDSPIWTGTYLAAEAMRYLTTGAPDARAQIEASVRTLHRWWRISGDRGYLSRYAVPTTSPQPVLNIFDPSNFENHRNFAFEGGTWHWKGNISRDQYQGAMLGFALAYDAVADDTLREIIRSDVVETVEQLMERKKRPVNLVIDGVPLSVEITMEHVIYTNDETPNGVPRMVITTNPFDAQDQGLVTFWPNPSEYLREVPLLGWLPDIPLRSQAIQLGAMFAIALHVTEGVPAYAARRQAILAHYQAHVGEWLALARDWIESNQCGSSYHGLNIAFEPIFNWARLEQDPVRKAQLQGAVLRDAMWSAVDDHKNVFFAYIYASQASAMDDVSTVVAVHNAQLAQFPAPPNTAHPVDNTASYPADSNCEGLSAVAIDVADRVPAAFMWERNPWKLVDPGDPNFLYPGIDYLAAYWMGRYFGFLQDDSPNTCLRWRTL